MEKYYLAKRAGDLRPGEKFVLKVTSDIETEVFICEQLNISRVEAFDKEGVSTIQLEAEDIVLVYDEDKNGAKETIDIKEFLQNIQKVIASTIKKKPLFVDEETSKRFIDLLRTWR